MRVIINKEVTIVYVTKKELLKLEERMGMCLDTFTLYASPRKMLPHLGIKKNRTECVTFNWHWMK